MMNQIQNTIMVHMVNKQNMTVILIVFIMMLRSTIQYESYYLAE